MKLLQILIAVIIAVLVFAVTTVSEGFSPYPTAAEKTRAFAEWFSRNPQGSYVDFRDQTSGDIIDYTGLISRSSSNLADALSV